MDTQTATTAIMAQTVGVKPRRLLAIAKSRGVLPVARVGRACLWNRTDAERLRPGKPGNPGYPRKKAV